MYFWHAVAEVTDCAIVDNDGGSWGGGVYLRYAETEVSFTRCRFEGNPAASGGGAVYAQSVGALSFTDCTFTDNTSADDAGAVDLYYSDCTFTRCTFDGNSAAGHGAGIVATYSEAILDNCIISDSVDGEALYQYAGGSLLLDCCNLFGNPDGDYTDNVADQLGLNGNISADPLYCGIPGSGDYRLRSDSPCASDNSGCGRMGAWDVGCDETATAPSTWSQVKTLY